MYSASMNKYFRNKNTAHCAYKNKKKSRISIRQLLSIGMSIIDNSRKNLCLPKRMQHAALVGRTKMVSVLEGFRV
jgi:hypothetical protein